MHLPPLSSPVLSGYYSSGDVSIAGDVVMGSGVILRANPGYSIRIHAGVCLGLGVILHASEGNIVVASEAILGAGVLVVGWAEIGLRACIGSAVTLMNVSIAPGQIVAPGSLLGQWGRVPNPERIPDSEGVNDRPSDCADRAHAVPGFFSLGHTESPSDAKDSVNPVNSGDPVDPAPKQTEPETATGNASPPEPVPPSEPVSAPVSETVTTPAPPDPVADPLQDPPPEPPKKEAPQTKPSVVYGKDYFLQMRFAMFPHHSGMPIR